MEGLAFKWEPLRTILAEPNIRDLVAAYFEELSPLKETIPLDVDYERMAFLEEHGMFRIWAARNEMGTLVGFVGFHLMNHLNYRTTLFAIDAGHYLDPAYRKGWTGVRLWRSALDALREIGVKAVMCHDNAIHPLDALFARLGFVARAATYWKVL